MATMKREPDGSISSWLMLIGRLITQPLQVSPSGVFS